MESSLDCEKDWINIISLCNYQLPLQSPRECEIERIFSTSFKKAVSLNILKTWLPSKDVFNQLLYVRNFIKRGSKPKN